MCNMCCRPVFKNGTFHTEDSEICNFFNVMIIPKFSMF